MRLKKEVRIAVYLVLFLALIAAAIGAFAFFARYGSYKVSPATVEEVAQMNVVERWFFGR